MADYKTPGVYVVEKNAYPNSVVEVATAVPAFIGYTAKAVNGNTSILNTPYRITGIAEFIKYFGGAPHPLFDIDCVDDLDDADLEFSAYMGNRKKAGGKKGVVLAQENEKFILYYSMRLFFNNGGQTCYIVSVGNYDGLIEGDGKGEVKAEELISGIDALLHEQEPSMVVVPEAMSLAMPEDCKKVQQAVIRHCGEQMKNRFGILDIFDGFRGRQAPEGDCIEDFRNSLGNSYPGFAAAYYPWVNTNITKKDDFSFDNISSTSKALLREILTDELEVDRIDDIPLKEDGKTPTDEGEKLLESRKATKALVAKVIDFDEDFKLTKAQKEFADKSDEVVGKAVLLNRQKLNTTLNTISRFYVGLIGELCRKVNLLPPAAAVAGIYTSVDDARGVWKAPANVSLASVESPAVNMTDDEQQDLNVTPQGKSVNAIRNFVGEGSLVWGARTLDGNSAEWRYISVRRTMIMLEESIRLAMKAYAFETNEAQTWLTVKSMVNNFLSGIWKRGGLAGASPREAFAVKIGLGETMTANDILVGIMRISVQVAVNRPAEFMVITLEQQMHES